MLEKCLKETSSLFLVTDCLATSGLRAPRGMLMVHLPAWMLSASSTWESILSCKGVRGGPFPKLPHPSGLPVAELAAPPPEVR